MNNDGYAWNFSNMVPRFSKIFHSLQGYWSRSSIAKKTLITSGAVGCIGLCSLLVYKAIKNWSSSQIGNPVIETPLQPNKHNPKTQQQLTEEQLRLLAQTFYRSLKQQYGQGILLEISDEEGIERMVKLIAEVSKGLPEKYLFQLLAPKEEYLKREIYSEFASCICEPCKPGRLNTYARFIRPMLGIFGENEAGLFDCILVPYIGPDTVYVEVKQHEKELPLYKYWQSGHRALYDALELKNKKGIELPEKKQKYAASLIKCYKIHLMPLENVAENVFLDLAKLIKDVPAFQTTIKAFKIKCEDYKKLKEDGHIPKIVIYVEAGKKEAQFVLDALYKKFGHEPGYTGYNPRYNERVTDMIWFAQGDGDAKWSFPDLFEPGDDTTYSGKVYYRSDLTPEGAKGGYYLINPAQH